MKVEMQKGEYPDMQNSSLDTLRPLSGSEQFFKSIYKKNPQACLDIPKSIREIDMLVPELASRPNEGNSDLTLADSLHEKYFPRFLDIILFKHDRYAPAFTHSHSFFEIIYVLRGTCKNYFSSHSISMHAGNICILAPDVEHAISAFSDDTIVYNILVRSGTFEQTFLNSLPQQGILYTFFSHALYSPGSETYLFFKCPPDSQLLGLLNEINTEFSLHNNYYDALLNALLTNFFIKLLRRHEKDVLVPNPTGRRPEENIIFILKYITNHYNDLTLSELAQFFNYSERQMARILKDYTGKTFTELIQNAKLTKACDLLKNTDMPIQTIIETTGYSNCSYFYNIFKEQYQVTPADYRKLYSSRVETIM